MHFYWLGWQTGPRRKRSTPYDPSVRRARTISKVGYAHNGKAYRGYAKTDAPDAATRVLKASVPHRREGDSHRSQSGWQRMETRPDTKPRTRLFTETTYGLICWMRSTFKGWRRNCHSSQVSVFVLSASCCPASVLIHSMVLALVSLLSQ